MLISPDGRVVLPSTVARQLAPEGDLTLTAVAHPVQQVSATRTAFAVVTAAGAVVAWGDRDMGGSTGQVQGELARDVARLYANAFAFCALKGDGTLVTWGLPTAGGLLPRPSSYDLGDQHFPAIWSHSWA